MNAETPAIGEYWSGYGGIYAGVSRGEDGAPDAFLVVATITSEPLPWQQALDFAVAHTADGHRDFRAPTTSESALCAANLQPEFQACSAGAYWTNKQRCPSSAWVRYIGTGSFGSSGWEKKWIGVRVRAVRRIPARLVVAQTPNTTNIKANQ